MPVQIHGKNYITVAERVLEAHLMGFHSVETEVLSHSPVVIKAKVTIQVSSNAPFKTYTGISSVSLDSAKSIEKSNPYEVAETSAVGRALGFAGFGIVEGIASADELVKAGATTPARVQEDVDIRDYSDQEEAPVRPTVETKVCSAHDEPEVMHKGASQTKKDEYGNPKTYWYHKNGAGQMCFGSGYKS